ncbi:threonine dehydrogenase-like Zn-dependent dehydrogenase [Undibacterium pigrum]|uniref:Threonine dehydrogenase-like Zn-dependent dehydrogenase n=2 Tax=Undibacterium pigrum TaxID=401470 RepID=A0A318JB17_9BURK|nr:threonine dehydrogenase-like Zn-dependent dehydrogenase [Undibacterium pigrum]
MRINKKEAMSTMKAAVYLRPGKIAIEEKPVPVPGPGEALIKITTTTICGTDIHILKGEYPVKPGLTIGHEPVGVIAALGAGVTGYELGQRVVVGAISPCGQCYSCLDGQQSQCGGKPAGGWRFGNTIDGCQAEYLLVPYAMSNLEVIPEGLTDEQVLMCPDIMSTGFGGAESGDIKIGDTVVIFAQGPIGLCATAGAKLRGASLIIAVDGVSSRLEMAKTLGADITIDYTKTDPLTEIMRLTQGRGVDVAIEALGTQATFESCLRALKPGGRLSSLGVYSGKLSLPLDAFAAGLGDHKIITTLCPGGKDRMRRLMNVVKSGRVKLDAMVTHRFKLDDIEQAYDLFANQRDGVLKVAITT